MSSSNVPLYRVLPYLRRRKAARSVCRERKDSPKFHLKRALAQINTLPGVDSESSMSLATLLLGDISLHGVKVFAGEAMYPGQKVSLTIEHPRMLFVRGKVVFCREISRDSNVISLYPARFRVLIAFEFRSVEERFALKRYLAQIDRFHQDAKVVL